ncbi:hypothetical protein OG322_35805 [Streptomyces sp. NBC_01260]|uniref:hypothetical protein n=1 Tax=unclassified Streptomyces TaxID=2593676 RepID=UPI001F14E647|nr:MULTISPECIES: hypothetical protein [unclassified Streptomyces]MCX4774577.1 hypothetical protein [Streptomyces sp. NBC_01285]
MFALREVLMRKDGRTRRRAFRGSAVRAGRAPARAAPAGLLVAALLLAVLPSPSYAGAQPTGPDQLYRYGYSLGFHPFTSPHDVRGQLTDNFWLFPVSGDCPAVIRPADECELLGGNPVRVEAIGYDSLQIATLPGHDLGEGLHIRFAFTRSLGLHCLVVSAWQNRPTRCTERTLCSAASRAGAWALWRVLSETLTMSAYAA